MTKRPFAKPLVLKLSLLATLLTLGVILLGSYTRLTDAGLGCPDWPGCYGKLIAPHTHESIVEASSAFGGVLIETQKAWTEMIHRYFAGSLGLLIVAILGVSLHARKTFTQPLVVPSLLAALVIFQAALGMWTVTLRLLPLVVTAHLLGGLATFGLLWLLCLQLKRRKTALTAANRQYLLPAANLALLCLMIQLLLGGWVSTNYAALICPDFPYCQGQWIPPMTWHAFDWLTGMGLENPLMAFTNVDRVTIHMAHRFGAIATTLAVLVLVYRLLNTPYPHLRHIAFVALGVLTIQLSLGIANVVYLLPLPVAVLHTGFAALLLATLVTIQFYSRVRISTGHLS